MKKEKTLKIGTNWDNVLVPALRRCQRSLLIEVNAQSGTHEELDGSSPINLALVIDRSGSMHGRRLEAAKTAALGISKRLGVLDRLSLVSFDHEVTRHFANLAMNPEGLEQAQTTLMDLHPRGSTNLGGGWFEGAACIAERIDRSDLNEGHVLLLSDGMANKGVTNPDLLRNHAEELALRGIQTSTIGIGENYSPLQLDALAQGGQGRLHDAETSNDIIDVVLGELGEIRKKAAQDVQLIVKIPEGVKLEILSEVPVSQIGDLLQISLGTVLEGRKRPIAVLAEIPSYASGEILPFEMSLTWRDVESGKKCCSDPLQSKLRVVPSAEVFEEDRDIGVVGQIADLWEATLAYRAMLFNERGNLEGASNLYQEILFKFSKLVSILPDSNFRIQRLERAQSKVARHWSGRSKREALAISKKQMLNELDLRKRDMGKWHDRL